MIDVLAMPALAATVVAFLVYIWVGWLSDKKGRALSIEPDDEGDGPARNRD